MSSTQAGVRVSGPDGGLTESSFAGTFTVTDAGTTSHWVLEDSMQQRWTIDVDAPMLPAQLLSAGEQVQLRFSAMRVQVPFTTTLNQTVALSRGGQLLFFGAQLGGNGLPSPSFSSEGIGFDDDGAHCVGFFNSCGYRRHRARVTIDGGTAVIDPGTSQLIGGFRVSLNFTELACRGGNCDDWSTTGIVGVRTP